MRKYEYNSPDKIMQNSVIEEIERYKIIADYFWMNAMDRLVDNDTNKRYLNQIVHRLSELKNLQGISNLCSKLIRKLSIKCLFT